MGKVALILTPPGVLPVEMGGTGATTAAAARSALGAAAAADLSALQTTANGKAALAAGYYGGTSNEESEQTINLGFYPKAVIVAKGGRFNDSTSTVGGFAIKGTSGVSGELTITTKGFKVKGSLNTYGVGAYLYIALY